MTTEGADAHQRVIRNAALLLLRQLLVTGLGIVATALIARHLGPAGFGRFEYTFALVGVFATLSSFGLRGVTIRTVAQNAQPFKAYIGMVGGLRLVLSLAVWPVLIGVAYLNDDEGALLGLVAIASLTLPVNALGTTLRDAFSGLERFDVEAATAVLLRLATFVGAMAVIFFNGGVTAMVAVYSAGAIVALLVPLVVMWASRGPIRLRWSTEEARRELRTALPFGANAAVALLMWEANPLLIESLSGLAMVGVFAAGSRLLGPLSMIPDAISDAMAPAVARAWVGEDGVRRCGELVGRSFFGLIGVALPLAVGTVLCADEIIALVFGPGFDEAADVLRILAAILPLEFLALGAADALAAIHQQTSRLWITCGGAAINVALTVAFVPHFGAAGCALAVAATTLFCSVAYVGLFARHCRISVDPVAYLKLVVSVAVMGGAVALVLPYGLPAAIAVGAVVCGAAAAADLIPVASVLRALRRPGNVDEASDE